MAGSTTTIIVEEWMGDSPGGRMHLKAQRCSRCGVCQWPPSARCKACSGAELTAATLGPDAELWSVTVDRMGTFLGHPHLVGQVRFPEGTFAQGYVVGEIDQPPDIGSAVELVPFEVTSGDTPLLTYAFKAKEA